MSVHAGLDGLRVRIAYGMFDTRGRIDPFSPDSPLKLIRVEQFPADFFFVLRVVQVPPASVNWGFVSCIYLCASTPHSGATPCGPRTGATPLAQAPV